MSHKLRIPMSPEELPAQGSPCDADLPLRPSGFTSILQWDRIPDMGFPRDMPRSARFVGMVEWAWGPVNSRIDPYYLSTNSKRTHWLLWAKIVDEDQLSCTDSVAFLYACCPKKGVSARAAAFHMLIDTLSYEAKERNLDPFHFVSAEGMLSAADLMALSNLVWPEEGNNLNNSSKT